MIYPEDFEAKIGFTSIRTRLVDYCNNRIGKSYVDKMTFCIDFNDVNHKIGAVAEMKSVIESSVPFPSVAGNDVAAFLGELNANGSFLEPESLLRLMNELSSFAEVEKFFSKSENDEQGRKTYPELSKDAVELETFPELIVAISRVIDKFGEVKDSASPILADIRSRIRQAQGSVQRAIRKVIDQASARGIIEKDATPSVRDGRLVVPVSAGKKREISGIVHDESSTGKTVFIEPAEVVEASNRIRELEMDEKREIIAILTGIADQIRPFTHEILKSSKVLGFLDFVRAKAKFAIDTDGRVPVLERAPELEWYHAVHPGLLLKLREQGREVVPMSLTLTPENRILVISGPNAGGKSVTLKTVAIVQYMLQCGMLPTLYENSHCGIFRNLFIDIGDEQSIENDLSTYSSHLRNMKMLLRTADKKTLFLADEMGSGTEPQIGGAIAQSILMSLAMKGAMGIVTTHFHNLKTFAETTEGLINGAMLYDRQHLEPTFQLSVGTPGSSFALDIAHKMGLPKDVIDNAKEIVGSEYVNLDKYLSDISRDRRYWASKRMNIREKEAKIDRLLDKYDSIAGDLKSQRKEIILEARREAAEILKQANAKIERTILEIRNAQAEKERTKELRKELTSFTKENNEADIKDETTLDKRLNPLRERNKRKKNSHSSAEPPKSAPAEQKKSLSVGDYVVLDDGKSVGQINSLEGKKAEVVFGALRTFVPLSRLKPTSRPKSSALTSGIGFSSETYNQSRDRQLNFRNEIDVRGMRADEALQAVTYFLDDAIQFGAGKVRILHGTGHGILKTLIRQQLKANTAVSHFEDEDIRFGGAGITVVEFD